MSGERRGRCAGAGADLGWRDMRHSRGQDGGRGHRNQYYATGLTGLQRGQGTDAPADPPVTPKDRYERLETQLDEVLARLARLEGAE
jgi:hypothetical protein